MNNIYVDIDKNLNATLSYPKYNIKTKAYIGKNGYTSDKKEGDNKTPLGEFELGEKLTTHNIEGIKKINDKLYFVDDINSKYYNTIVETSDTSEFSSAEHLIDYKVQYEYFIEIKYNKEKIPGKGSCIVLHCKNLDYTQGCIAVSKDVMKELITLIDDKTKIIIREV